MYFYDFMIKFFNRSFNRNYVCQNPMLSFFFLSLFFNYSMENLFSMGKIYFYSYLPLFFY